MKLRFLIASIYQGIWYNDCVIDIIRLRYLQHQIFDLNYQLWFFALEEKTAWQLFQVFNCHFFGQQQKLSDD